MHTGTRNISPVGMCLAGFIYSASSNGISTRCGSPQSTSSPRGFNKEKHKGAECGRVEGNALDPTTLRAAPVHSRPTAALSAARCASTCPARPRPPSPPSSTSFSPLEAATSLCPPSYRSFLPDSHADDIVRPVFLLLPHGSLIAPRARIRHLHSLLKRH